MVFAARGRFGVLRSATSGAAACALVGIAAACGHAGQSGASAAPSGEPDSQASCQPSTLALSGANASTPHGSYELSHVVVSAASFSASLPSGGSVQFDWTGDATAAAVAITGQLSLPAANEGPVTVWCIDSPSTLRIVGTHGELVLSVGLRGASPCSATGEATTSVGAVSGCVDVSS